MRIVLRDHGRDGELCRCDLNLMKILGISLGALLLLIAGLQVNDPDPTYWVIAYGLSAAMPVIDAAGKRASFLAGVAMGMLISGMIFAAPGFLEWLQSGDFGSITGSMEGPDAYVEPAREFLGLAIALAVVAFYARRWRSLRT